LTNTIHNLGKSRVLAELTKDMRLRSGHAAAGLAALLIATLAGGRGQLAAVCFDASAMTS
jgi:hypothetical protein